MLAFREKLREVAWDPANKRASLDTLFQAVDDLAMAEMRYYYRRRGTRAIISGIGRFGGWVFGTIGLLLPLLAATKNPRFVDLGQYGYVFLAAAASCLGANALFGGSEGHIRFVTTQLEIEKLVTQSRIAWLEFLASHGDENMDEKRGFKLIKQYATDLHTITIAETGRWGAALLQALSTYQNNLARPKDNEDKPT